MALSEYEKQVLAEMEAQLNEADPSLASVMTSSLPAETPAAKTGQLSPRRIALGSIIAVVGLAVVVSGVSLGFGIWAIVLGVLGFSMMVGGVLLALKTSVVEDPSSGSAKKRTHPTDSGTSMNPKDFMSRQQERWDRREK